jgi:hypothetical protein
LTNAVVESFDVVFAEVVPVLDLYENEGVTADARDAVC